MSKKPILSNSDRARANLIYARDLLKSGRIMKAHGAITRAIGLLANKSDGEAVDNEVIRLLNGGAND